MSRIYNDISKLKFELRVIEQYNNFKQLGAKEDIEFLKEKVSNLFNIKDSSKLIEEFTWCAKMINMYFTEIEPEFKNSVYKDETNKD